MTNFTDEGIQSVGDEINEPDLSNGGAQTRGMEVEAPTRLYRNLMGV
jgi:hypothetical protein